MSGLASLKAQAKQCKQHTFTVYFAALDPRTPIFVRALVVLVAAYALSPIDLIPDFIPVIGFLDDLLLVPIGVGVIWLTLTVCFEFIFGHYVAGHSWSKLFYDYNVFDGRIWCLLLMWITAAPYVFYRLQK